MGLFDWKKKKKDEDSGPRRGSGKPDFSNVRSGSSTRPAAPQPAAAPAVPGAAQAGGRSYTVQGGDSLWKIAERHYGDGNQWRRIYDANRATIDDPDVIHPGQELAIP